MNRKAKIITASIISGALLWGNLFQYSVIGAYKDEAHHQKMVIADYKISQKDLALDLFNVNNKLQSANKRLNNSLDTIDQLEADKKSLTNQVSKLNSDLNIKLDGKSYVQTRTLNITASAYSQRDEEGTGDGITFTETRVTNNRTVAVDPKIIPLGSMLYIESDSPYVGGIYFAEDTGGAIDGNRIDIFMSDKNQCFRFGKQNVKVTILKELK